MARKQQRPTVSLDDVRRLWLHRQGLSAPRGSAKLTKRALTAHLETTGALQLDSVNVVDRAHYLTLWSRFGPYDRAKLDRWIYDDQLAYEHWGHEASLLPVSHLPLGLRAMRRFPPDRWRRATWWKYLDVPVGVRRHVLRRLREEGPLESAHFERGREESTDPGPAWGAPLPKESKRALKLLWHAGRIAVRTRRHFRCVYDLAERIYPETKPATSAQVDDHWLLQGLRGNGVASEKHLVGYLSAPQLAAADRKRILARQLAKRAVVEVEVEGRRGTHFALPQDLDALSEVPEPTGTHLVAPFDSLLWQRRRAEDLCGFRYRLEIYVPEPKREFGYYAFPILHHGRFVGRLDPKLHRERSTLEVKSLALEEGCAGLKRDPAFRSALADALRDLARFVDARAIEVPRAWRRGLAL